MIRLKEAGMKVSIPVLLEQLHKLVEYENSFSHWSFVSSHMA